MESVSKTTQMSYSGSINKHTQLKGLITQIYPSEHNFMAHTALYMANTPTLHQWTSVMDKDGQSQRWVSTLHTFFVSVLVADPE